VDISEGLINQLGRVSPRLIIEQKHCRSEEETARVLRPDNEVLYTRYLPSHVPDGSALRWIQYQAAGIDCYLDDPVFQSDVMITTTSGAHAGPAAEFIIGVMVALARDFPQLVKDQEMRRWDSSHSHENELRGKTVGVVGYGSIGRQLARLCVAFGMRILAVKRDQADLCDRGFTALFPGDPEGRLPEKILPTSQLGSLVGEVDFLVITAPFTKQTLGLIDEAKLRAMKRSSYLINVARGPLVDIRALARALREGYIAGAAIDVFEIEPLDSSSDLWSLPNLLITPHVLASRENPRYDQRCNEIFAENLKRYLMGKPLVNLVRKELGY
jgi:phosphoglycerate dehydrogenase-like enzyme